MKRQCEEKEQRLAVLEENFSSAQKEVAELRSCLREVERSRLEARRELQEQRRQVCCPSITPLSTDQFSLRLFLNEVLLLAPAEGPGWREGAEREGGGRAADSPVAGGAKRGGEREGGFQPQAEVN